jgi:hypothetical protein
MSYPQLSQVTTVSALTTDSGIVVLLVDSEGGEETTLLPLTSIFHCPFIEECSNSKNERWAGYAYGAVKSSCRGINHGKFPMC